MEFEKSTLMPLPQEAYRFRHYKKARVNIDYHIEVEGAYYSVAYVHTKKVCDVYFSSAFVEVYLNGKRIAVHARIQKAGQHVTLTEHMPKSHQKHVEWTPSRIIAWAQTEGESVGMLAAKIMETRSHPEQGYRSCLGLIRLGKSYGAHRLEAACKRALAINGISYKSVQSILKNRLDEQELPLSDEPPLVTQMNHENVRGKDAYQ
jgi:transposase